MIAPLIVPVEASALVVNSAAMNFLRAGMHYTAVAECDSPAPGAFANDWGNFAEPQHQGIYVMWTLPKALRRRPSESSDFPFVPNRWLVVRLLTPETTPDGPPEVTAWVVESDGIDAVNGASAYVDPTVTSTLTPTMIGLRRQITPASPWQEPSTTPPYFLRAVAEANPAFAAFQQFNENVFSVFDDLQNQGVPASTVSYYVVGWYSDPAADILAADDDAAELATTLGTLGWSADTSAGQTTDSSLYQGAAFAVPWTPGGPPPPSPKDDVKPQVAVGSTSMDAVVAFARAAFADGDQPLGGLTPDEAAELIAAFQYSLLPMLGQPGAEAMIEQQVRSNWFSSSQSGSAWVIVDAEQDPNGPPPTGPADWTDPPWLGALNAAQSQFDSTTRQLLGVQRQLFTLWWKQLAGTIYYEQSGYVSWPWGVSQEQFSTAIDDLAAQARTLMSTLNELSGQIPMATDTLTLEQAIAAFSASHGLPATKLLKQVAAARFWAPVDPVVVVSNTAHLMNFDPDDTLPCRWPADLVTAIQIATGDGAERTTISATQVAGAVPAVAWSGLPPDAEQLFAELFLLDPANVAQLATAAGVTVADIQAAAASMSPPQIPAGAGAAPAHLAAYPWTQPWRPLYLDWRIEWFPVPFQQADGSANWTFGGLDYDLVPSPPPPPPAQVLQGRTVLTPKPAFEFKARIDQFIAEYPDNPLTAQLQALEDVIGTVDGWDFLSQSMSGLGDQVAGWNPVPTPNPDDTELPDGGTLATLVGTAATMPPNPQLADEPRDPNPPPSTFEGMRGGQFYIEQLTIVDAFGQTLEIVESPIPPDTLPRTRNGDVFLPLIGDGLAPTTPLGTLQPGRFVQLPPRILQPARLNLDFVAATDGDPIVGWILPNHLDSSLAVYGPDGTAYGALRLGVDASGTAAVAWDPAPNSPWPTIPPTSPQAGPLTAMLAELYALGPGALSDLLQSVDESLWTIDPLGGRADTFLTVLIGRPLAVVTAAVSFDLQAEPWRTTDWPYTFADPPPDPLFLDYRFAVRLGDLGYHQDGLIGYYAGSKYSTFNCIHLPERGPHDPPLSGYLEPIGVGNFVEIGFAADGPGTAASLTLLMDPRAGIHAQCALVPVKAATLPPAWVDAALAAMTATFRTGPALVAEQQIPASDGSTVNALLLPRFAEQRGVLSWLEADGHGGWTELPLATVDDSATLPPTPPTLRDGLLKLSGGVDS
jgi:hypothetical protein